jgi:hypothetical protein
LNLILASWQTASDLAGLRDPEALKMLAAEERDACKRLWDDVAELLKQAEPSKK